MIPYNRKVVVITGASAGIGRATARAVASDEISIALIARGIDGLEAAKAEVEAQGGKALLIQADMADADAVEQAASRIEQELGPIDVWINNASVAVLSPASELEPAEIRRVTDVAYLGYVWGTQAALRRMKARDRGVIIQVVSAEAYRGVPLQAANCAAEHAIKGFTDALWCELAHEGSDVRLSTVVLPPVNTPRFDWMRSRLPKEAMPVSRMVQPETAARAIVRASLRPRREIWVGGRTAAELLIAERLLPGMANWLMARFGHERQQGASLAPVIKLDNLWKPLPGDRGARGRFDALARASDAGRWMGVATLAIASLSVLLVGTRSLLGAAR